MVRRERRGRRSGAKGEGESLARKEGATVRRERREQRSGAKGGRESLTRKEEARVCLERKVVMVWSEGKGRVSGADGRVGVWRERRG